MFFQGISCATNGAIAGSMVTLINITQQHAALPAAAYYDCIRKHFDAVLNCPTLQ
jgi:hypothetical protein